MTAKNPKPLNFAKNRFMLCTKRFFYLFFIMMMMLGIACKRQTEMVVEKYPDGTVKAETEYGFKNTVKVKLKRTEYYRNGNKKIEGKFRKGERHGTWTYWYENGEVWSKGEYDTGKREGETTVYYYNGTIRYKGQYRKNQKSGTWQFYNEKGELVKEVNFDK